jgi:fatty acid desaturase
MAGGPEAAASATATWAPAGSDYARLARQVRQAELMRRRPGRYAWQITLTAALLAAGWAVFVLVGESWWQLAVAVFLAIMFTQLGFLGHDAGHRQICGSRRASYILGIIPGNLGIGLSYGWWVSKHSRHHASPNTEGEDPDIMMSVLAFTPMQARNSRGLIRILFRCQAYPFFPLLLGEAISLHFASVRALAGGLGRRSASGGHPARAAHRRLPLGGRRVIDMARDAPPSALDPEVFAALSTILDW